MESSDPPSESVYLVILLILLLLSMFFSASEISFLSASRLRIRYLAEKREKAALRVEHLLRRKGFFLNAILIGNNIVNIATSALITSLAISFFGDSGVGIATAVSTVVILVFGEILPKSVALQRSESIALHFSLPLTIFLAVTSPLVAVFSLITRLIARLFGVSGAGDRTAVTEEDIKTLIEVGEEEGLIETREKDMLHKILRYTDLTARDIMTPRTDIVAIPLDTTRGEALEISRRSRYSRFPVYGDDIDDIRGILYIKDLLFAPASGDTGGGEIRSLVRPALFVLENRKMSDLQNLLRAENQNIAVVIDEYGGTAGIVSGEDLVEEIFGGIRDEYDRPEPGSTDGTYRAGEGEILRADGGERLGEIGERLGISLVSEFYDTVGGWIMERHGDIPVPGTRIEEQGFTFTVETVSGNRIEGIRIERTGGKQ